LLEPVPHKKRVKVIVTFLEDFSESEENENENEVDVHAFDWNKLGGKIGDRSIMFIGLKIGPWCVMAMAVLRDLSEYEATDLNIIDLSPIRPHCFKAFILKELTLNKNGQVETKRLPYIQKR